jgi:hypothetical protein
MALIASIIFLFLYYIRPQDWIPGMAGFNIIRPMVALWLVALFSERHRTEPRRLFVTPHDWLMLIYLGYVVWNAPSANEGFTGFFPLVVFYALTVRSLDNWEDLLTYLKGWNAMLLGIAVIALASLYGFDFTHAAELTAQNKGRLCIGTWLHDNPNALGHSVIVVLPLSYLLYFWRGSLIGRLVIFPAHAALSIFCTYKTESKGAFLVGGALCVLIFVFGRPLIVRLFVLALAATVGISALSMLPRMSEMGNLRADEGVQGRLMAWQEARTAVKNHPAGVGWRQFSALAKWQHEVIEVKTHSSYIQLAADLGIYGLAIYLGGIWAALRSAVSAYRLTADTESHERCRRALILLISAYAISGWMINRQYHTEYFLVIALAGVVHRLVLRAHEEQEGEPESLISEPEERMPEPLPMMSGVRLVQGQVMPQLEQLHDTGGASDEDRTPRLWRQLGLLDVGVCAGLTWSVLYIWDYVLKNL